MVFSYELPFLSQALLMLAFHLVGVNFRIYLRMKTCR